MRAHDYNTSNNMIALLSAEHFTGFSPISFIKRPALWPQTISKYKAMLSPSPDFGYSLAAKKISDDELAELDLSSWVIAQSGLPHLRLPPPLTMCVAIKLILTVRRGGTNSDIDNGIIFREI